MSDFLPDGWSIHKISDIAKVGSSKRILQSEYVAEGVPFFRSKEVILRSKREPVKNILYISRERFDEIKNKFSAPMTGEILITAVGTIGVIYLVEDYEFYFKDGNLLWIKDIADNVNSEYLAKYMASDFFQTSIERISGGSTQAALTIEKLSELEFNLPPLPEQQKIAKILASVSDMIEKTQAQIDKLNDLKTSMMQELLINGIGHADFKNSAVGRVPAMWEVVPLGNKVKLIPGYAFNTSDFVSEGVPLIRMGNLYQNKLGLTRAPKYLPLGFIEKHNKFVIKENDIVFSMTGTSGKEDYGFAVKIPESSPLCLLNQRVAKIVAGDGLKVNFLLHLLHSRTFLDEIYAVGTGTKQANLSATHIINVELAFPPLNEQVKIASALDSVSNHILVIKEKLAKLKNTNKALMQDLLTGKIRVNTESINTEVAVG